MTTQIKLQKPHVVRDAHPRTGALILWLGLPPDIEIDEARHQFRNRYGYGPPALKRYPGALLAGPIVEEPCLD